MDVTRAITGYLTRLLTSVGGMKVLLLDKSTTPIVSLISTHSTLLSHEVYLTDRLENKSRDRMKHLRCIALIRPDEDTVAQLIQELRMPKYQSYFLAFTSPLSKNVLQALADADSYHVVQEVQEFFADYHALTPSLFSLGLSCPPSRLFQADSTSSLSKWDAHALDLHCNGIVALLLSLKKKPVIRYERMSALAKTLGEELHFQMNTALPTLFEFRRTESAPLLLILDRRNDPVTPLLTQWTYQAMVHELLGITNGRVDLSGGSAANPGAVKGAKREENQEIVLTPSQDTFFSSNMYDNFGDLGASIKKYVLDYQSKTPNSSKIETVSDMKRFVEEYPEFRKLGGNVSKHVALLGELSKRVEKENLLEVSELEQSLASNESHAADLKNLNTLLASPQVHPSAKLRLVILYALRYQRYASNRIDEMVRMLLSAGVEESKAALVYVMLNIAGAEQRQDDLFSNENFFSRGKSALKGLKGVENVYTRHSPHLAETVENLVRGRLREQSYPYVGNAPPIGQQSIRPQEVIIFIVGGATYEGELEDATCWMLRLFVG
ncbi:Sec1-like protein [Ceraceosorus guamensis]|uniref:Sec1-like protein n=1 Tax=Ceraceosorus guamensis TaxID=1522189 RepID=A0A316VXG5_9BASI|nr:Sec1-like protein [Ceraceosorus guamensis]PWN40185.1 Sec1-like protein [Ceraceosorus guamensis]